MNRGKLKKMNNFKENEEDEKLQVQNAGNAENA